MNDNGNVIQYTTTEPTLGRVVHYVLPKISQNAGQHRAATITEVWRPIGHPEEPGMVNLVVAKGRTNDFDVDRDDPLCRVIYPTMAVTPTHALVGSVLYSAEPKPGTWHWPEREGKS